MIAHMTLSLSGLPADFDGMTVAVISDVHADVRRGGPAGVRRIVEQVNATRPDLIVLLGDLIHRYRRAPRYLPLLAGLRAPEGVWACLGNHEHACVWYSRHLRQLRGPPVREWRERYAELGIELLFNEATPLERGGSRVWIVGVGDTYSGQADLPAALSAAQTDEFCLAITHHPDLIDDPAVGGLDLLLAGHTHGGQIYLPILGPVHVSCRNPRQRAAGLVRANGTVMYVTRGAGEGVPLRLGCPREIPIITLRSPGADDTAQRS